MTLTGLSIKCEQLCNTCYYGDGGRIIDAHARGILQPHTSSRGTRSAGIDIALLDAVTTLHCSQKWR
jgi:hypothetical protein